MKNINVIADINKTGTEFKHTWNKCVGAGRAAEGLRSDWQTQLKLSVKDCGFKYIRFHGLLCEDMGIVHRKNDGTLGFNFAYLDSLFDSLLEIGIKPFVEFGFMPSAIASGEETQFWWRANITPPKKMSEWEQVIHTIVKHWQERYGNSEIEKWYYEIWNEPNLSGFWTGTKTEYFELYKTAVLAIKSLNKNLRVGGPATSNFVPDERFAGEKEEISEQKTNFVDDIDSLSWKGVWIVDFLNYCEKENLPVDFVSTHPYPTDFALDTQKNMKGRSRKKSAVKDDLLWLNKIVKSSFYSNAEIHLTEWSSSPTSRDFAHDFLPAACYVIKSNLEVNDLTDSLSYWVFTDIFEEAGPGPSAFHGGFGMQTVNGIVKPTHHAYRMLNALGNQKIEQDENYVITKNQENQMRAIFYNYPNDFEKTVPMSVYPNSNIALETQNTGESIEIDVKIKGFNPETEIQIEFLSKDSGCAVMKWLEYGAPSYLDRKQEEELKKAGYNLMTKTFKTNTDGVLEQKLTLDPWTIVMLKS